MGMLRALFGPSKEVVWRELAQQVQGQFTDGGLLGVTKVVAKADPWLVTLDTHTVASERSTATYTRMRAPFVNADGFRFTIYPEGLFSPLGRALGMQDIIIGDARFDAQFVIKGNDEAKVRTFFNDPKLQTLLYAQTDLSFQFQVKHDEGWFHTAFPQGVDELYFHHAGIIRDLAHLRALFDLFSHTLHRLCQLGSAYETDPGAAL